MHRVASRVGTALARLCPPDGDLRHGPAQVSRDRPLSRAPRSGGSPGADLWRGRGARRRADGDLRQGGHRRDRRPVRARPAGTGHHRRRSRPPRRRGQRRAALRRPAGDRDPARRGGLDRAGAGGPPRRAAGRFVGGDYRPPISARPRRYGACAKPQRPPRRSPAMPTAAATSIASSTRRPRRPA